MSDIKAIQTRYKGYHFRSRLEARWAVFFDTLGIEWEYEPEGFIGHWDQYYLPDFKIKCYNSKSKMVDFWVEVKPSGELTQEDSDKIYGILDYGGVIPGYDINFYDGASGFIILGNIPDPTGRTPAFRFIRHHKGLSHEYFTFCCGMGEHKHINFIIPVEDSEEWKGDFSIFDSQEIYLDYKIQFPMLMKALAFARSARFEHGQNGAT